VGYGQRVDFAAPPWWVQALWLVGVIALVLGGTRVSRALLARVGRGDPPLGGERLFAAAEWFVAVGMVVVIVLILLQRGLR
jgi:hypothetical protein